MATTTTAIEQPGPLLQWPQYEKPSSCCSPPSPPPSDLESQPESAIISPSRTSSATVTVVSAQTSTSTLTATLNSRSTSPDAGHAAAAAPMPPAVDINIKTKTNNNINNALPQLPPPSSSSQPPPSVISSPSSSPSTSLLPPPPPPPLQPSPPPSSASPSPPSSSQLSSTSTLTYLAPPSETPKMKPSNSKKKPRSLRGVFSRLSNKILSVGRKKDTLTDLTKQQEPRPSLRRFSLQPDRLLPHRDSVVGASGLRRSWLFDKRAPPNLSLDSLPKERPSKGTLFFALPVELQLEIVTKLIYSDIIALRKTSRAFNSLIVTNEHEIARRQIDVFVEARYIALYPPDCLTKPSFAYLSRLATKSIAASELSRALVTQLYDDFRDKYFEPHPLEAKPLIIRYMTERLRFSIMIIQHFLEQFAERKLRVDRANGYPSRTDDISLQEAIMEKYYTTDQLVEASDFYRLTLYLLWQNVSMAGSHERVRRVWALLTDTIPAVQDLTKFMLVGGIGELRNVYRKHKPATRRKAIARFAARYKNEQARSTKLGAALLPRVSPLSRNIKRYSKLTISPNIFHLWIHPAQNVLFRKDLIEGLNQFRCIDEIVGLLLDGWEEWAYGDGDLDEEGDSGSDGDDEDGEEEEEPSRPSSAMSSEPELIPRDDLNDGVTSVQGVV
ncbi:hypothetical protein Dda_0824 [Drechslerella dactyloides]|uniref:F-box domain-containing protein n=1 Tax=Drechslerella dactyloides TaxID=74499 RepID=A0AAD6J723_DREDA|nr:hypothetical protein Dda_0824 [Drechslerella dactyloides]